MKFRCWNVFLILQWLAGFFWTGCWSSLFLGQPIEPLPTDEYLCDWKWKPNACTKQLSRNRESSKRSKVCFHRWISPSRVWSERRLQLGHHWRLFQNWLLCFCFPAQWRVNILNIVNFEKIYRGSLSSKRSLKKRVNAALLDMFSTGDLELLKDKWIGFSFCQDGTCVV